MLKRCSATFLISMLLVLGAGCASNDALTPTITSDGSSGAETQEYDGTIDYQKRPSQLQNTEIDTQSCCKMCSTGKACGDSCISRSYTCHKAPGCACDS